MKKTRRMMEKEMKTKMRTKRMSSAEERNEGQTKTMRMMRMRWTPRSRRRTTTIKGLPPPLLILSTFVGCQWHKGLKHKHGHFFLPSSPPAFNQLTPKMQNFLEGRQTTHRPDFPPFSTQKRQNTQDVDLFVFLFTFYIFVHIVKRSVTLS